MREFIPWLRQPQAVTFHNFFLFPCLVNPQPVKDRHFVVITDELRGPDKGKKKLYRYLIFLTPTFIRTIIKGTKWKLSGNECVGERKTSAQLHIHLYVRAQPKKKVKEKVILGPYINK